jgi:hypothetical protein
MTEHNRRVVGYRRVIFVSFISIIKHQWISRFALTTAIMIHERLDEETAGATGDNAAAAAQI